ncbi:globin domain-containing protein [Pseudonocardia sp. GCM10023141]|uniref:globin domain-containing protein n=1 Tax=Pseudonocardia sp. GCM10023141 TaxID=3252653 RepID=UPI00361D7D48
MSIDRLPSPIATGPTPDAPRLDASGLDASGPARPGTPPSATVDLVRRSWALVEPQTEELTRLFYGLLFGRMPETRSLFPVNMQVQRGRLLRALVHVVQLVDRPDELEPFLDQLGRDHRKFDVADAHYDVLGGALVDAVARFSGAAWTPQIEGAWRHAYRIAADRMRTAAAAERGPASWTGVVLEHRRIGWDLAIVRVQTDTPIPYRAGQYLSVETPHRPRLWRYLSPAGPPRPDGVLEFHVRAVEGGWVSRAVVAHTTPGETWRIGPPMGRLSIESASGDGLLLIAGGTGVAPVRAIVERLVEQGATRPTTLFTGGRTTADLYDLPHLRTLGRRNAWLDVVPVIEKIDEHGILDDHRTLETGAEIGTLADVVSRYGAWRDHDVIVCGSPAMVRATVGRLLVAGTPLDRIRYDPFTLD